ncbi:hypothetical protein [Halalkalicoccus tibetensis]|uniref:RING-type E3 ubiquitin transferase n=1 Tax=Halalkalicoccus tibetensis TaxID=175632 RepID=A0ABD5V1K9_9EURY
MVDYGQLLIGFVALGVGLWLGYQVVLSFRQYTTLSKAEPSGSAGLIDGEAATIEGQVLVDEPADEAGAGVALAERESALALLVWRIRRIRHGGARVRIGGGNRRRTNSTLASGIEPGEFRVATGNDEVRVNPEWLLSNHATDDTGSITSSDPWSSPYIHLGNHTEEFEVDGRGGLPGSLDLGNGSIQFGDSERFQSKAIPEGERVVVHGETAVENGEPVVRGTDGTALVISDQPIEGLVASLRNQVLKSGALAVAATAVGAYFLYDVAIAVS